MNDSFETIQQKSSRGIKWQGLAELFIRFFQFAVTIVLARLLLPQDFGLINVALIFTQLAYVLFDLGFSSALIQKKEVTEAHYSTTFTLYLISATFFYLLVLSASSFAAAFFKQDVLRSVLSTLAIIFFLYALRAIPQIRLMRAMRFKLYGVLQMISVTAYGLVTIFSAWQGRGVWSFVYGSLAEQMTLTLLVYVFAFWRPRLGFDRSLLKELAFFGGNVMGTRLTGYLNSNAPNFVIGRALGTVQLGYYSIAYQLVDFPVQRISKNVLRVMFPALSQVQDDPENFKKLYLQTIYHLALVTFPIFAGLTLIAPQFVRIFYGEKWLAAIVPLQILTIIGLARSVWATTSVVFLAKGKPYIEFYINMLYFCLLLPALIFSASSGLEGVATTVAVLLLLFLFIAQWKATALVGISWLETLRSFLTPLAGVSAFMVTDTILRLYLLKNIPDSVQLMITIFLSASIYISIIIRRDRDFLRRIVRFLGA